MRNFFRSQQAQNLARSGNNFVSNEPRHKSKSTPMEMRRDDFTELDVKSKVVTTKINNAKSKEEQDAWEMLNS